MSVVKVMVTWLQLSSLASSVQVPTSPAVRTLLDWQSLGNVSPWSFSSFNCVVSIGFYQRFYACCLVPVGCAASAAAVVGARALLGRKRLAGLEGDVGVMATQLLWLLTYTMVTEAVMSVFVCRELDDGYWVLSRDVEVECGTPQHRRARRVGLVMLALHTVGVPLQAALLMGGPRGARDQLRMRVRFGFLYENFRDATFWYESFGMLRKASMVAVVTFFQDRTGIQVFTVSWVALTYLTVHSYTKPYTVEVLNRLETFALFVSAVTLSSCSFFFLSSQLDMEEDTALQGQYEQAVSAAVVGLSAALFAWCGIVIARDLTGRIKLPGLGLRRPPEGLGEVEGLGEFLSAAAPGVGGGEGRGSRAGSSRFDQFFLEEESGLEAAAGRPAATTVVTANPLLGAAAG